MFFGTTVDDETSFAVLDRFAESGGTFLDTSNNYAFWTDGGEGGESEALLGRWIAARGHEDLVVATKVGAMPTDVTRGLDAAEGLSEKVIRAGVDASLKRLGVDRIGLYYAHVDDRSVSLEETVGTFGALLAEGKIARAGCSNHQPWRLERARAVAAAQGWEGYTAIQQRYTYLRPRPWADFGVQEHVTPELLDYVRAESAVTLLAYSSLAGGAYTRADKKPGSAYRHEGSPARLAVLHEVAAESGATANQVVLAWLLAAGIVPVLGVSTVEQLDECLAAADVRLDADQVRRLDVA
ncbi:aldo/keto reductase [Lentzea sp. NPDC034063]|uniref:aldo/keto reductase n=1 Tax=unclassified Lentzea TaxID=2643253 RepID=UPI0033F86786